MAGIELPYWKTYAAEVLSDSRFQGWDIAERGAFWTLLNVQWREGAVPGDRASLAKLLRVDGGAMASLWSAIGDRFIPHPDFPGMLANPRMEQEREEALALVNQKKRAGKLGAESRWAKARRANGTVMAPLSQTEPAASATALADGMAEHSDQRKAAHSSAAQSRAPEADDMPPRKLEVVDEGRSEPDPFPLTTEFRRRLSEALARTAPHPPGGGIEVFENTEAALRVLGIPAAVEIIRLRDIEGARQGSGASRPRTLKLIATILADEVSLRAAQPKGSRRVVGADGNGQPVYAEAK